MKVLQTERMLVVQERPWLAWLVGGLFVISGSYVVLTSSETLFGGAFVVLGAGVIVGFANTVTCTFDGVRAHNFRRWPRSSGRRPRTQQRKSGKRPPG